MTTLTPERIEDFARYRRKQIAELRPWVIGDDMSRVSVSAPDMAAGSPKDGDMIARNPKNHADQWLVAAQYFADNFEPVSAYDALSRDVGTSGMETYRDVMGELVVKMPHSPGLSPRPGSASAGFAPLAGSEGQADDDLIRIGCKAADVHLTCSWPRCQCTQIPKAIQAALNAQDRRALSREALVRMRDRDDRNGSLPAWYRAEIDAALSDAPAQTEQIASVRRCVEWSIPQLNCGNMSKDEFFDYLVSLFGTISAHEAVRDIQERWRRDKSERDHLRYVLSREPAQGGESPKPRYTVAYGIQNTWIVYDQKEPKRRLATYHSKKFADKAAAELNAAEDAAAPPQPIPTPDEALRDSEIPLDWLTVRAILLAVRPDWKPHSGGEATDDSRAYELTELVIRQTMRHMMRSTCSHCKTKKWTWNFYRCWDCKTYLCEGCIKYHFGSGHIPHPKTIEQFEAEIAALSRARPEEAIRDAALAEAISLSERFSGHHLTKRLIALKSAHSPARGE